MAHRNARLSWQPRYRCGVSTSFAAHPSDGDHRTTHLDVPVPPVDTLLVVYFARPGLGHRLEPVVAVLR